ncbi:MAG: type III-A CRISPR-associated protein Csm2 [bacterium]
MNYPNRDQQKNRWEQKGRKDDFEKEAQKIGEELSDLGNVNTETLINKAKVVGEKLEQNKLKMNQLRRFLDAVRRIESRIKDEDWENSQTDIILLRPKLAYAAGREPKVKPLMYVLDKAIQSGARSKKNFEKLLRLIESIVAYHRFYGGKN